MTSIILLLLLILILLLIQEVLDERYSPHYESEDYD
ncbi:hypothetical protein C7434_0263 [Pantoea sp. PNA 14-12]|nr:hypothetical protein C7434_0263 [Pantoea sp. PNA 14-12]